MNRWPTDFLFAEAGYVAGAASVFDLFAVFPSYNRSRSDEEADLKALLNDWYNVGSDIAAVMPSDGQEE